MRYLAFNKRTILAMLIGAVVAVTVIYTLVQSSVQDAETDPKAEIPSERGNGPTYPGTEDKKFKTGEIIVKIEDEASPKDLKELNRETGARTEEDLPKSDVNLVDLPKDLPVKEAVKEYEKSSDVEYAQPNYRLYPTKTTNDTYYSGYLYGLNNTGQNISGSAGTANADIDAPGAWEVTTGLQSTVVAVIDEGVDVNHPDLKDNIWQNPDEIPGNNVDDDENGYVDDINVWDFANDDASVYDPDPITGEGDEHGTHVAGTIAAQGNNSTGVSGVNWDAQIMSLKFLGANGGNTLDAIEALNYAVDKGVKISNNSWGGGGSSQALYDAIKNADAKGHLFVAVAGNDGANNNATASYPANYDLPNVISVAATNNKDTLAGFSNYGATKVDLAAPGVSIASTAPDNGYVYMSGTSVASPHVTGVAALIKSQNSSLDDGQIKSRILQSVDKKDNLKGKVATGGRLNAFGSLKGTLAPTPVATPTPTAAPKRDTTNPIVTPLKPRPGSSTRDHTPTIKAVVRDPGSNLGKANIKLYGDGRRKGRFSYNSGTDRLTYRSGKLSYRRHTVQVAATDPSGNTIRKTRRFKVKR